MHSCQNPNQINPKEMPEVRPFGMYLCRCTRECGIFTRLTYERECSLSNLDTDRFGNVNWMNPQSVNDFPTSNLNPETPINSTFTSMWFWNTHKIYRSDL